MSQQVNGSEPTLSFSHATAPPRRVLVVLGDRLSATYRLPTQGSVIVGRDESVDILVRERSVSRRHAVVHVMGDDIFLEDLGSANGTWVDQVRLVPGERVRVGPGQAIRIASRSILFERLSENSPSPAPSSWASFEIELQAACLRAQKENGQFALLRFCVDGPAVGADIERAIRQVLPQEHLLGANGEGDYQALIWAAGEPEVDGLARAVVAQLTRANLRVGWGVAFFPRHGVNPHALSAAAHLCIARPAGAPEDSQVVVKDSRMQALHVLLSRVAQGTINVLLLGETGVGKEVFAEQLHRRSPRAAKSLLRLNCAGFSETLLESELFGHERGAFTGANQTKRGLLESAEGGTVFLDEVADLPLELQGKLLRVLEDRQVRRVGGLKAHPVDVRFVSATNRDIQKDVAAGRFRQDLFFRLNGMCIDIPPLRERGPEIESLARFFLAQATVRSGLPGPQQISSEAWKLLMRHPWPGNIRELRNVIERAALLCTGPCILPEHLPAEMREGVAPPLEAPLVGRGQSERERILSALEQCAGNQTRAARLLGMARNTLIARLEDYAIARPRSSGAERDGDA